MDINDVIRAKLFGSGGSDGSGGGSGIVPSGTLDITENGSYDVTNYAKADVNVEASGGDSGGGLKYASGTVTPATDGECRVTGLDFTPLFFKVFCDEEAELDGNSKLIGTIYVKGSSLSLGTNASGTANAIRMPFPWNEHTVLEDDYTVPAAINIATALKTGFLVLNSGRDFLAGYTYTWEAWGE